MALRVAINGFGRIGRLVLRSIVEHGRRDIEVVAINDLGPVETNAHLLRYDSIHGRFPGQVTVDGDSIDVGAGPIRVTAIRNPAELPHRELGVDTGGKPGEQIERWRRIRGLPPMIALEDDPPGEPAKA